MQHVHKLGKPRRWRTLFIFVALIAALSGAIAPASASSHPYLSTHYSTLSAPRPTAADMPIPPSAAVSAGKYRYFSQTAHFLRGVFLTFWESHGATPVLGLPLTEALDEDGMVVQYLERVRLEWHPDVSDDPRRQVLLTRLGAIMTGARGLLFDRLESGQDTPTSVFFTQTGHNLSNAFLRYWQTHGGLAVFGYPISEEVAEPSQADGKTYTVQYFERNRFEWHPENPSAFNVQIGLLGVEYARMVGLNPLARVLLAAPVDVADQDLSGSPELAELVEADLLPAMQKLARSPQFRWVPAVIIQNNVPVEFADIGEEGVAGATITTRSRTRPYLVVVAEAERGESTEAIASILAHEATHVYDIVTGVTPARLSCSVEEELRAYMNGLASWVLLKGDDALDQRYDPGSLEAAINRSVRGFNDGKTSLDFDFNPQEGRKFLRALYGADCGK
jgi:hypothetical protein